MRVGAWLFAAAVALSCNSSDTSTVTNLTPSDIDQTELMHTPEGNLPILVAVPNGQSAVAVVYDDSISDPITDWGACMELARRCYYTAASGAVAGCIRSVKRCTAPEPTIGGADCCPGQCLDDFGKQVDTGTAPDVALYSVIVRGDCVKGYPTLRDRGGP